MKFLYKLDLYMSTQTQHILYHIEVLCQHVHCVTVHAPPRQASISTWHRTASLPLSP